MEFGILAGDTDQTIYFRLRDSTTGLAKTGLAYNSAGASCYYTLPRAAAVQITLATQTVAGAHSDGGFVEVHATNAKGLYRLDLPDAAVASGNYSIVSIEFDGAIEDSVLVPLSTGASAVGEFQTKYNTAQTLTVTNLQSLASSSTFLSGWTSAWIENTTEKALNIAISGNIVAGTTVTAGSVRAYLYAQHSDGSTAPNLFSSGTEGTEGTATVHDTEQLNSGMRFIWSSDIDTTNSDPYPMPPCDVKSAFGFVPRKVAVFIAHNSVAALAGSGNAIYAEFLTEESV